jgi:hypothetical protein
MEVTKSLLITKELEDKVRFLAYKNNWSQGEVIRQAIMAYLNKNENNS